MKLLKFASLTLALLTLANLGIASAHGHAGTALAMEPASWVFVAFGLAGGGFLHKRRLRGINLTSSGAPGSPGTGAGSAAAPKPSAAVVVAIVALSVCTRSASAAPSHAAPGGPWPVPSLASGTGLPHAQSYDSAEISNNAFPVGLGSTVKAAPEPGSLFLLGTGFTFGALAILRSAALKKS